MASKPYSIGRAVLFAFDITPSDTVDLDVIPSRVWIGGAGNLKIDMAGQDDDGSGGTVTLSGIAAGTELRIRPTRVYSTGTTATAIVGMY